MCSALVHQLISPVQIRAKAHDLNAFGYFSDKFARSVLQKLGIEEKKCSSTLHGELKRRISHCAWVDLRARQFFETHVDAQGIEINGGLSTRFYRLSESLDWPRFSWISVNTPSVDEYLNKVFPFTDNFRHLSSQNPTAHWYRNLGHGGNKKRFVIFSENAPFTTETAVIEALGPLVSLCEQQCCDIDVVLCHTLRNLGTTLNLLRAEIHILSFFNSNATRPIDYLLYPKTLFRRRYLSHHLRIEAPMQGVRP